MRQFYLPTLITITSALESIPTLFEIVLSKYNSSWKVISGEGVRKHGSGLGNSTFELE